MKMKVTALIAAALCGTGLIAACGSDASSPDGNGGTGGGSSSGACASADQQFPMVSGCDEATRMCFGVAVPPDVDACNECLTEAQNLGQPINALTECACSNCAIFLAACFQSATREPGGNATRDMQCRAVVECAQQMGCSGVNCLTPCQTQIQAASGCADPADVNCLLMASTDTNTALGRALAVSLCVYGDAAAMPPVPGNCMATTTAP